MADHVHQQILQAVQAALISANTAAQSRVDLDRTDELPESELPAISILPLGDAGSEAVEYLQTVHRPPLQQDRAYTFSIHCISGGDRGSMKVARNLAASVEVALLATATAIQVGGKSIRMLLSQSEEVKTGAANTRLFSVRQQWQAQFRTVGGVPTASL